MKMKKEVDFDIRSIITKGKFIVIGVIVVLIGIRIIDKIRTVETRERVLRAEYKIYPFNDVDFEIPVLIDSKISSDDVHYYRFKSEYYEGKKDLAVKISDSYIVRKNNVQPVIRVYAVKITRTRGKSKVKEKFQGRLGERCREDEKFCSIVRENEIIIPEHAKILNQ